MPLAPYGDIRQIFSPRLIETIEKVQELGHEATVRLISRHRDGPIDPDTGMKSERVEVHVDNITARIQPMYAPGYMESPAVDTIVKRVRVQMNRILERIDLGWELEVVSCENNPALEDLQYTNMETFNSSNMVDTTLMFQVNPRVNRGI